MSKIEINKYLDMFAMMGGGDDIDTTDGPNVDYSDESSTENDTNEVTSKHEKKDLSGSRSETNAKYDLIQIAERAVMRSKRDDKSGGGRRSIFQSSTVEPTHTEYDSFSATSAMPPGYSYDINM